MFKPQILWAVLIAATVPGYDKPAPPTSQARPAKVAIEVFLVGGRDGEPS